MALLGLQQQWSVETVYLQPRERARMTMPVFWLSDFSRTWGRWDRGTRQIAIRRDLVHDYPWSCIRDVLRHEMAHQYVDEILGGEETPHGPRFRQACRVLRADAKATCEYTPLHARDPSRGLTEEDRLVARVKKLLALGESPNPHQAQAALAKAHKLMGKGSRYTVRSGVVAALGRRRAGAADAGVGRTGTADSPRCDKRPTENDGANESPILGPDCGTLCEDAGERRGVV